MVIFPNHVLANTPSSIQLPGSCSVAVRIKPGDDLKSIREYYSGRLLNWEMEEMSLHDLDFISELNNQRVLISIDSLAVFETSTSLRALAGLQAVFRLRPNQDLIRELNFLSSRRFRVHIDTLNPLENPKLFEEAVDFYLHNPLLNTPIEPFHAILFSMAHHRALTLWEIEGEDPKRNCYISEKGEISLGKRWIDQSFTYGTIDDMWDQLNDSKLLSNLVSFKSDLFRQKNDCIFCSQFEPCGGFLRAIDKDWPCEPWQRVFSILREATHQAAKIQKEFQSTN
jgi:hypothetical protein